MISMNSQYTPVSQHDAEAQSSDFPTEEVNGPSLSFATQLEGTPRRLNNTSFRWEWITRGVLILLSAIFFTLWITSAKELRCTYVTKYSPANEAIEYIESVKYNGSLHFTTPWGGSGFGNPSPDIDAAWRHITTQGELSVKPLRVTEEQLHKMGMVVTPATVKIPDEEGGGYLSSLEITHHLQCLDMLRKATYREYYESFDPAFQVEDETLTNQLDTCVELLRQALMCYPDTNMVVYYWVHGHKLPIGNPNTIHRCKNLDKILDWAASRVVEAAGMSRLQPEKAEKDADART